MAAVAIGLQVLLGALTTGLSAVTSGHQVCLNLFVFNVVESDKRGV